MADRTGIAWTDHTFNPWIGCQKVSPGCDNCLTPDTVILYRDRSWRPLADARAGDELLGFPESEGAPTERLEVSTVERVWPVRERAVEIRTSEHVIVASYGHPFAAQEANGWRWREPRDFSLLTTQLRTLPATPLEPSGPERMRGRRAGPTGGDGTSRTGSGPQNTAPAEASPVVAMADVGETDLIDIQTSTGTFFANGFAVHNCYAETLSNRRGWTQWGPEGKRVRTGAAYWRRPLAWNRQAQQEGRDHLVFCASLADVMDNQAPEGARDELFALIQDTPNLIWQLLSKRPQNFERFLPEDWGESGYRNVWLGVSAENQEEYDRRWPILAATPAVIRFISYEPALDSLTLAGHEARPDWLIWGGESGPGCRPMEPAWARRIEAQCAEFGVAVFAKQWGDYRHNPLVAEQGRTIREAKALDPHGKGGAMLDGREPLREFPRSAGRQ